MVVATAFAASAADFYVIGEVAENNYAWAANVGAKMTEQEDGTFTLTTNVKGYFGVTTQLGASSSDWSTLNSNRLVPPSSNYELELNVPCEFTAGAGADYSWKVPAQSDYTIVLDPSAQTLTITAPIEPVTKIYGISEYRKFTNIPTKLDARGCTLVDGTLYVKIKGAEAQIITYNETGLTSKILETDANTTNICHDDAGNIIIRQSGAFPGVPGATESDVLTVFTPEGEQHQITLPLAGQGLPATRLDFYSDVVGNILEGDAYFFYPESGTANLHIVAFTDGEVNEDACAVVELAGAYCDTATKVYPWGEGKFIFHYRGANPIVYSYEYDDIAGEWNVEKVGNIVCPGRYNSNGIATVNLDGVDYIIYPSGTGYFDGFSIAELTTDGTADEPVATFEQTTTAMTSGFQSNWLFAQKLNETSALIYQYFPGGWVKVFKFTAAAVEPEDEPEKLYAVGTFNDWNPEDGSVILNQDVTSKALYYGEINMPSAEFIGFALSGVTGDWDTFNSARWGAETENAHLSPNTLLPIVRSNNSFEISEGVYDVTVDLLVGTIHVSKKSGVAKQTIDAASGAKVIGGYGEINVIGGNNVKVYSVNGTLVSNKANTQLSKGVYIVTVDGKTTKVVVK